jgi:hypothetical protein
MKKTLLISLAAVLFFAACKNKTTQPEIIPLSISFPANGAVLTDSPIIHVMPGSGFSFSLVDLFIDSTLVFTDSIAPYLYSWNIFSYPNNSSHIIKAVGYTADSTYAAGPISVTISVTRGFYFMSHYQPSSQNAVGVTSYNNLLFISTGDAGLEMIDISNRTVPQFLARYNTPGQALKTAVNSSRVYIADRDQGVTMANYTQLDSIIPLAHLSTQGLVIGIALSGNLVLVAENDYLQILRQADLDTLFRMSFSQDVLNYIVARSDTAFIVGNSGFYIVDCTSLPARLVGSYGNLSVGRSAVVADTFAFIANSSEGVIALSISDPTHPRFLARFNPNLIITSVAAGNSTLFAGTNSGVIYALNYGTPDALQLLDQFSGENYIEELSFQNYYLYAAARSGVEILRYIR